MGVCQVSSYQKLTLEIRQVVRFVHFEFLFLSRPCAQTLQHEMNEKEVKHCFLDSSNHRLITFVKSLKSHHWLVCLTKHPVTDVFQLRRRVTVTLPSIGNLPALIFNIDNQMTVRFTESVTRSENGFDSPIVHTVENGKAF